MSEEKNIVILGGGPAGLACSFKLSEKGINTLLIEKDVKTGGFAKTLTFDEGDLKFKSDIGPHRFFSKNKDLYDMIGNLLGNDWIVVNRLTRQYIEKKYYDYPIKAGQAFKNIGPFRAVKILVSYFLGTFQYRILKKEMRTLEDYIVSFFGKELGEFNMLNYNRKIWGLPGTELHPEFVKQRVKGLSLTTALKNALFKSAKNKPKSLVDAFYYPRFGTGQIYETMTQKIKDNGSEIKTNSQATKINHSNNKITSIELEINGEKKELHPKTLVNSTPITEFLKVMDPLPPTEVIEASSKLKWRSQAYLFITLNKEQTCPDNWIYFPNEDIPFARYTEMKSFSPDMNPRDKTIVVLEFFTGEKEDFWQMDAEKLLEISLPHLEKANLFKKEEIRKIYAVKKKFAYPVYDINYPENLKVIKDYLDKFENLIYIGRPGRFHYNNQDHSLEMGIAASEIIADGKKIDLDRVGSEDEYFESGNLKKEKEIESEETEADKGLGLFIGYLIFAGFATLVDIGLLYVLTTFAGVYYLLSAGVSYFAGMLTNYTLNKLYNFRNKDKKIIKQFSKFTIIALIGLGLNQLIIWAMVDVFHLYFIFAKLISVAIVMFWSFWGHKKITFK